VGVVDVAEDAVDDVTVGAGKRAPTRRRCKLLKENRR
jgi:hypothetical protein